MKVFMSAFSYLTLTACSKAATLDVENVKQVVGQPSKFNNEYSISDLNVGQNKKQKKMGS